MTVLHLKRHERREIETRTLQWVNGIREERGQSPLPRLRLGRRAKLRECPIAVSLTEDDGFEVTAATWNVILEDEEGQTLLEVPPHARQFMEWFDCRGEFREYLA